MRTTDKGLQKAIKKQPHYELPSNFSYRMMQKIQEENILREKQQEKRMFILFLIFAILSGGSCIGFFIWKYGAYFISYWHTCKEILPDSHTLLFYLPTLCALCLLYFFDRWLRKKIDLEKNSLPIFSHKRLQIFHKKYPEAWAPQFFAHSIPT